MKTYNKKAYSIIVVILVIGFLMVLTIGIFKLVLSEMRSNNALGNYSKAYIGAESSQELALLLIKQNGYGYNEALNTRFLEDMLGGDTKDIAINYINDGKTKLYEGNIGPAEYHIIPLFIIENSNIHDNKQMGIQNYNLDVRNNASNLSWNILSADTGLVNNGENTTSGKSKSLSGGSNTLSNVNKLVRDFLTENQDNANYLMLYNEGNDNIKYSISSDKNFTKPISSILSSGQITNFKQNINTTINYADIVNRAKYSIYSGG